MARTVKPTQGAVPTSDGGSTQSRDQRALKQLRARLRAAEFRLNAVLASAGQGVSLFDRHHKLVYCNQAFLDIYKLPPELGKRGTSFRAILEGRVKSNTFVGSDPQGYVTDRIASVREERVKGNIRHLNSGQVVQMAHHPMADGGWVSTHKDVTETVNMQAELTCLAFHDQLTGLPNRAMFYRKAAAAVRELSKGVGFCVLCLDLDGFKPINDTMGHAAGDALLRSFADRLQKVVGASTCAARMGGDEFAVLLRTPDPAAAMQIAQRIVEATALPFDIDGRTASVSVGVGVAAAPDHGDNADALMHAADLALYAAKRRERGPVRMFDVAMISGSEDEQAQETELRRALEHGEFELLYQPIIDLRQMRLTGFEALLRWRHPDLGLLPPESFVGTAERSKLIIPIGEWVLRQAISEAAQWPGRLKVTVNVSAVQLGQTELPTLLVNALAHARLSPDRLEIELTESALPGDVEDGKQLLKALHGLGVKVALDDFGSGHSALRHLLELPLDRVKLGRRLISALRSEHRASVIINAVSEMGRSLGIATTAEGLETAEQLRLAHRAGFDEAQGYLISRPLSAADARALLAADAAETPAATLAAG